MSSDTTVKPSFGHLVEKLQTLSPARLLEVEDFIDFLRERDEDRRLTRTVMTTSEPAFQAIWDNPEDAEYDKL